MRLNGAGTRDFAHVLVTVALAVSSASADTPDYAELLDDVPSPWVEVAFVIIKSTPDYEEARQFASSASAKLGVPLNLRGVVHDPEHGLTFSREACASDPLYPYPCYVARGRFDPGTYISVERSDAYSSFKPGLFVVIASTGEPKDAAVQKALAQAREVYPDAYAKIDSIYHGCMH